MSETVNYYTAEDVYKVLSPTLARTTLTQALAGDFDPADDPARTSMPAGAGSLLCMPSVLGEWTGCKLATVAPHNPDKNLPLIHAVYCLFDTETLRPQAFIEGASLTEIRTPAMSAVAVDYLAAKDAQHCVIFGTGLQAIAHAVAMAEVRNFDRIAFIGRSEEKTQAAIDAAAQRGVTTHSGSVDELADADVIVCCTAASEPLFDGTQVKNGACVVAMGSHEPANAELDAQLMQRSLVAVESLHTALAEAGDVIRAGLGEDDLYTMRQVVQGEVVRATDRPNVFKGTGMSWQDVAAAAAVVANS